MRLMQKNPSWNIMCQSFGSRIFVQERIQQTIHAANQ